MAIYEVYTESKKAATDGKIELRDEQLEAVAKAKYAFEAEFTAKRPFHKFLWNAKMRFGKTLCAMQLAKERGFKRTLIVTHRPVVNQSWKEDFKKIFQGDPNWRYGTKFEDHEDGSFAELEMFAGDALSVRCKNHHYVFFVSMQYIRLSSLIKEGGDNDPLKKKILNTDWDLVVVDEAHEGTLTVLGSRVVAKLSRPGTCVLHLSGTPFNLYDDFAPEEIFTWDYIAEQKAKREWEVKYPMLPNPYAELPVMKIFTYDLGKLVKGEGLIKENAGFMFTEFFRTWTGHAKVDGAAMPAGAKGQFVHEQSVREFLDLLCKKDETSNYPFSTDEYRKNFKHTLWVVPGVAAAKALESLLKCHAVFKKFHVINVAGESDDDVEDDNALTRVLNVIGEKPELKYTITISCGRLTTGTTVRPWTAVFYMKGSENTNAATYMQTIFRVQTPYHTNDGRMKAEAYVFDFAPDRSIKMLAETARFFAKTKGRDKLEKSSVANKRELDAMKELLDFCPVISYEGGQMKALKDENALFAKLSEAKIDRVVQRGFDDVALYNVEELLKKDPESINRLLDILGRTPGTREAQKIDLSKAGLKGKTPKGTKDDEQGKEGEGDDDETKKAKAAARKERDNRIAILRGVSLRIPLLMFGAEVSNEETDVTVDNFAGLIDDASWTEFMPRGFTKKDFKEIKSCYDQVVFNKSWQEYRQLARAADSMMIEERIKAITTIFSYFHNPDKETVLTPWRVVNMHMSDTIGGWCFYNEKFDGPNIDKDGNETPQPRWVEQKGVTKDIFCQADENGDTPVRVLEINSKTGLYPLYVTYSLYRSILPIWKEVKGENGVLSLQEEQALWDKILQENIFVICNTPMAARITERTLRGFRKVKGMHIKDEKLVEQATTDQDALVKKLNSEKFWLGKGTGEMKFNTIVGNPPYQQMDNGSGRGMSAIPLYHLFVDVAKRTDPRYISMITPSRWFAGGKGLDDFRQSMITDRHLACIVDYFDSADCFPKIAIAGGVNYFLWDATHNGSCEVTSIRGVERTTMGRALDEYDIFIRNNQSVRIIQKVLKSNDETMEEHVFSRNVFGIVSSEHGTEKKTSTNDIILINSQKGNNLTSSYISRRKVIKNQKLIDKYKVIIGKVVPRNGEVGVDPSVGYRAITTVHVISPGQVFTESYLLLSVFETLKEAENFAKYMTCKFPRFLLHETYSSMNITKGNFRFVPYLDFSHEWSDRQLIKRYKCETEAETIYSLMRPLEYVIHHEKGETKKSIYNERYDQD